MLRDHRATSLLGVKIDNGFIEKTLVNLGFQVEQKQPGIWQVRVPHFRIDIEREADLIEEIARFYGYEKIPIQLPPLRSLEPILDQKKERIRIIRQILFHYGFDEVVNFSFMDSEKREELSFDLEPIPIRNPISAKAAFLRTTLFGGLLENIAWNMNRGAEGVHIFEIGNIFHLENEKCKEHLMLCVVMTGDVGERHWMEQSRETGFFHLKGTCEALMAQLRYLSISFREENHPHFREGSSLALHVKGERVGCLGAVKHKILDTYMLKSEVWAAEINLNLLFEKQAQAFQYSAVVKYPSVNRDVSFIADKHVSFEDIKGAVEKLDLPYLARFNLYDRFAGSSIPDGKVSLSFRFNFRHPERTLQADAVDVLQEKIIATLRSRFNFQLREGGKIDK